MRTRYVSPVSIVVWLLPLAFVFGCQLNSVTSLAADISSVEAVDCGFYNSVGRHSKLDGSPFFGAALPATFNYSTGTIDEVSPFPPDKDVFRKNYFTFDLAGYSPGSITGAVLDLYLPVDGYAGPGSLTYELYGSIVPGPPGMEILASELEFVYSPFVPVDLLKAKGLFSKIGDMDGGGFPSLGSITATELDEGTTLHVVFTPFGVSYLNMFAGGKVVLGGMLAGLPTPGPPDDPEVYLFGFSSPVIAGVVPWDMSPVTPTPTPKLFLSAVPEPGFGVAVALVMVTIPVTSAGRRRGRP